MSGEIRLKDKDNSGQVIVYNPQTPSSLEPFCLSCHDDDGDRGNMSPFSSSNILGEIPNSAGNKIAGYWNNTYSKHKDKGLTCAGSGEANTGCHGNNGTINMHGVVAYPVLPVIMCMALQVALKAPMMI